jgi:hypothetical protein
LLAEANEDEVADKKGGEGKEESCVFVKGLAWSSAVSHELAAILAHSSHSFVPQEFWEGETQDGLDEKGGGS